MAGLGVGNPLLLAAAGSLHMLLAADCARDPIQVCAFVCLISLRAFEL